MTSIQGSEANLTKTYLVNSGWAFEGTSTSGAMPAGAASGSLPSGGQLAPGQEADIIVTYESTRADLATAEADRTGMPTQDIRTPNDGPPFKVHVTTNSENPEHPNDARPNIGIDEEIVTCDALSP